MGGLANGLHGRAAADGLVVGHPSHSRRAGQKAQDSPLRDVAVVAVATGVLHQDALLWAFRRNPAMASVPKDHIPLGIIHHVDPLFPGTPFQTVHFPPGHPDLFHRAFGAALHQHIRVLQQLFFFLHRKGTVLIDPNFGFPQIGHIQRTPLVLFPPANVEIVPVAPLPLDHRHGIGPHSPQHRIFPFFLFIVMAVHIHKADKIPFPSEKPGFGKVLFAHQSHHAAAGEVFGLIHHFDAFPSRLPIDGDAVILPPQRGRGRKDPFGHIPEDPQRPAGEGIGKAHIHGRIGTKARRHQRRLAAVGQLNQIALHIALHQHLFPLLPILVPVADLHMAHKGDDVMALGGKQIRELVDAGPDEQPLRSPYQQAFHVRGTAESKPLDPYAGLIRGEEILFLPQGKEPGPAQAVPIFPHYPLDAHIPLPGTFKIFPGHDAAVADGIGLIGLLNGHFVIFQGKVHRDDSPGLGKSLPAGKLKGGEDAQPIAKGGEILLRQLVSLPGQSVGGQSLSPALPGAVGKGDPSIGDLFQAAAKQPHGLLPFHFHRMASLASFQPDALFCEQNPVKGFPAGFGMVFPLGHILIGKHLRQLAALLFRKGMIQAYHKVGTVFGIEGPVIPEHQDVLLKLRIPLQIKKPHRLSRLVPVIGHDDGVLLRTGKKDAVHLGIQGGHALGGLIKDPACIGIGGGIHHRALGQIDLSSVREHFHRHHALCRSRRQKPGAQQVEEGQEVIVHGPVVFADGIFHHGGINMGQNHAGIRVFLIPSPLRHIAPGQSFQLVHDIPAIPPIQLGCLHCPSSFLCILKSSVPLVQLHLLPHLLGADGVNVGDILNVHRHRRPVFRRLHDPHIDSLDMLFPPLDALCQSLGHLIDQHQIHILEHELVEPGAECGTHFPLALVGFHNEPDILADTFFVLHHPDPACAFIHFHWKSPSLQLCHPLSLPIS